MPKRREQEDSEDDGVSLKKLKGEQLADSDEYDEGDSDAPDEDDKPSSGEEEQALEDVHVILEKFLEAPNEELNISSSSLQSTLAEYKNYWIPDSDLWKTESTVEAAARRFKILDKLQPSNGGLPGLQTVDIETAYQKELFRWIQILYKFRSQNLLDTSLTDNLSDGLVLHEASSANADIQQTFSKIAEAMLACRWMLHSHVKVIQSIVPSFNTAAPSSLDPFQYMPFDHTAKLTEYQELLMFVLQQLKMQGFRRFRETIWEEIYTEVTTPDGIVQRMPTHAWRICRTCPDVEDFVHMIIRKEDRMRQWSNMTKGNNLSNLIDYLKRCREIEFAELVPDRNLFSFKNGILKLDTCKFFPYGSSEICPHWVSCNYIPEYFGKKQQQDIYDSQEWTSLLDAFVADADLFMEDAKSEQQDDPNMKKYDPTERFHKQMVWATLLERFVEGGLDTPNFDKIFKAQLDYTDGTGYWSSKKAEFKTEDEKINELSHLMMWQYALMGRLLFPVGLIDNWQVIPYFKGMAGSGKSTIINLASMFFSEKDIGTIGNEVRKGVGMLQTVYDKFLWRVFEVKRNFELSQAVFQSMVSGEVVVVDRLNKPSLDIVWQVPGILAGNDFFGWKDASGSLSRRCLVTNFPKPLDDNNKDPMLMKKLKAELPKILVKCLISYLFFSKIYEGKDIWKVICGYFVWTKEMLTAATDPFGMFLTREIGKRLSKSDAKDDAVMPLKQLLKMFKDWATKEEIDKRNIAALINNVEQLSATFKTHGLEAVLVTPENVEQLEGIYRKTEALRNSSAARSNAATGKQPSLPRNEKEYYVVKGLFENKAYREFDADPDAEDGAGGQEE